MVNPQADARRIYTKKGHNIQSNVLLVTMPCDITFSANNFWQQMKYYTCIKVISYLTFTSYPKLKILSK
jgi:hypothetical protein